MSELPAESLRDALQTVLDLEHQCLRIDDDVAELKSALGEPETITIEDTIALVAELRWHLTNSAEELTRLAKSLGDKGDSPAEREHRPERRSATDVLRGSTHSLGLPDLIGLLSAKEKTGTLWIRSTDEIFILELLRGAVVHAMSDCPRPDERLGTILVAQNKLSTDRLEDFLGQYCPDDGRIGEMLARASLVSENDLRDALGWQVRELFQRIFALEHAEFCFREGEISKLELRVSLSTTQLLLQASHPQREDSEDREFAPALSMASDEPMATTDEGALEGTPATAEPVPEGAESPEPS